ncbi:MAG: hypothetical protein NT062_27515 [Proteobacteria bacterium]|nr:hypothetical protein [Pseudomonadota bacterium]
MNKLVLILGLALSSTAPALADTRTDRTATPETSGARLIPAMKDQQMVGLKVYAIVAGGRFDQPSGKFANGDLITAVDGLAVTTEAGARALFERVIDGKADAVVTVTRKGAEVKLTSRAKNQ